MPTFLFLAAIYLLVATSILLETDASPRKKTKLEKGSSSSGKAQSTSVPKALARRMKHLLDTGHPADVHFLVGDKKELLPAHKAILAKASDVFEAMFRFGEENVEVSDVEVGTFKAMLAFIYADDLSELNGDNAISVLYAAEKYNLPKLVNSCLNIIWKLRNVFGALAHARFFGKEALRWADEKCRQNWKEPSAENRRAMLGTALFKIRLPLIPQKDFTENIVPSRVLTSDQMMSVYQYHSHRKAGLPKLYQLQFPTNGRAFKGLTPKNRWDSAACQKDLTLIEPNRLIVEHYGEKGHRSVRAEWPIPKLNSGIFYYEMTVLEKGSGIYIGLATEQAYSNCGNLWSHKVDFHRKMRPLGGMPKFEENDVIGCGMDLATRQIIYTLNGNRLINREPPPPGVDEGYESAGDVEPSREEEQGAGHVQMAQQFEAPAPALPIPMPQNEVQNAVAAQPVANERPLRCPAAQNPVAAQPVANERPLRCPAAQNPAAAQPVVNERPLRCPAAQNPAAAQPVVNERPQRSLAAQNPAVAQHLGKEWPRRPKEVRRFYAQPIAHKRPIPLNQAIESFFFNISIRMLRTQCKPNHARSKLRSSQVRAILHHFTAVVRKNGLGARWTLGIFYALELSRSYQLINAQISEKKFRYLMQTESKQRELAHELMGNLRMGGNAKTYGVVHLGAVQEYWDKEHSEMFRIVSFDMGCLFCRKGKCKCPEDKENYLCLQLQIADETGVLENVVLLGSKKLEKLGLKWANAERCVGAVLSVKIGLDAKIEKADYAEYTACVFCKRGKCQCPEEKEQVGYLKLSISDETGVPRCDCPQNFTLKLSTACRSQSFREQHFFFVPSIRNGDRNELTLPAHTQLKRFLQSISATHFMGQN
ncbi:hypothetical protein GPALN_010968 [Globodera pallida]|nr:hypothetical protein GPALN_010968 [Globodera pallida]